LTPTRASAAFAAALAAALLSACGAAPSQGPAPWAAAHPDPSGLHFTDAQGLCAITVRYPNDAPGEIDYRGQAYVQRDRVAAPSSPGNAIGRSADWTVYQPAAGRLLLVTPTASYEYRSGAKCGSNSAAPT
jgi:hypothetical protein